MWYKDGIPVPIDPGTGYLVVDDVLYPLSWNFTDMGLTWVTPEVPPKSVEEICRQIDEERDRRIDAGFTWNGHQFQSRPSDRENILGAATIAMAFLSQGGSPDELRWAGPDPFVWITADNSIIPLTAPEMVELFHTGVGYKTNLTFFARALKDAVIAAEDPESIDIYEGWPS